MLTFGKESSRTAPLAKQPMACLGCYCSAGSLDSPAISTAHVQGHTGSAVSIELWALSTLFAAGAVPDRAH